MKALCQKICKVTFQIWGFFSLWFLGWIQWHEEKGLLQAHLFSLLFFPPKTLVFVDARGSLGNTVWVFWAFWNPSVLSSEVLRYIFLEHQSDLGDLVENQSPVYIRVILCGFCLRQVCTSCSTSMGLFLPNAHSPHRCLCPTEPTFFLLLEESTFQS